MTKRQTKKIISVICSLVLLTAVLLLGYVLVARIMGKTPRLCGYSFHVVVTDSMTPEIEVGDLVVAKKTAKNKIVIGDDILFVSRDPRLGGITVVHRVVDITAAGEFVTKGVKEGAPTDEYTAVDPIGVVVRTSRAAGKFLSFLSGGKNVIFIVLMLAILAFIIYEAVYIGRLIYGKKDKAKGDIDNKGETDTKK